MTKKRRLSASIDGSLLEEAERAVRSGRAESLSAWVNDAFALKVERDRATEALESLIAAFEADDGTITPEEIAAARRRARARATHVRTLTASERTNPYRTSDEP